MITGATGFFGRPLSMELANDGYEVIGLSRQPTKTKALFSGQVKIVEWDAVTSKGWGECDDGALVIGYCQ